MLASCASHSRAALSTTVSSTGWISVGDREITPRTSLVAVCCVRASVSSVLRSLELLEQAHVLDGNHGLIGEGLKEGDLSL
jgi:hypothetical protein